MSEDLMSCRHRRPSSPSSVAPPDDDDLLWEILLRLFPLPSSLIRASAVCKRWRRLVSDPGFLRRFRARHRTPPLLGFFSVSGGFSFTPTLDKPDRIPAARLTLPAHSNDRCCFLGCRHGLALHLNRTRQVAVVWNPITGNRRCVPFPPGTGFVLNAAVLRPTGNDDGQLIPFKLVLLCNNYDLGPTFARIYGSEPDKWGNVIAAPAPWIPTTRPSILVGNTLCWWIGEGDILGLDLETRSLALINKPAGLTSKCAFQILRTEDNGLGLAVLSGLCIQLWKANSDGAVTWVLQKTIELDKLFSPEPLVGRVGTTILGFAEDANAIFLLWDAGVFMIELESLKFRKVSESTRGFPCYPYASFFTAGREIAGGVDGVEFWNNA
ncbi:uncharacterized protein LOC133903748 isoform X2 [Phragmites australis]|uniref:uncharacterized protein LOC133903748 isoform X2 n=1 Tax=Phragmites australis TaxID=29695 RepID=UPI002D79F5AF|nr:uncharacterized protein LOC133903748 isoform X2 [Phragmites australis]